jgi:NADH:ubiquinone reductase (H+-translocating)
LAVASSKQPARIVVLGGGYVGLYTALRLQKKLRSNEASVTVIDPQPHMTYQPFLPEAAAGSIEPRHVTVPLRRTLDRCHVRTARVTAVDPDRKIVTVKTESGTVDEIPYDTLVVALGAVTRLLPIPGLAEHGIGLKTIGEAVYLRNHVLSRLDLAASTTDAATRKKLLTFTVIGGGFAGVEALGELEDMARAALKYYSTIEANDMRWVLVEAAPRILPEVRESLGVYTVDKLRQRGIEVYLKTFAQSVENGHVQLSDGTEYDSDTIIWTAGVTANPVLAEAGLPLDQRKRVVANAAMQVQGHEGVIWAAGDCASVPDLSKRDSDPEATCPPNAQHAVRQAKVLADNILASLRDKKVTDYFHKNVGAVASLGLHKGVADVYNTKGKGWTAWAAHRAYHVAKMPTFNRKVRILFGWIGAGLLGREVVSMVHVAEPKALDAGQISNMLSRKDFAQK